MTVVDRAREDLAHGRPWLARDRLQSALRQRPADQEILGLLGEVHFAMNDLPAAGAAWFLTDRVANDATNLAAMTALRNRHANPRAVINVLPVHAQLRAYPPAARARLVALQGRCRDQGWTWSPPSPPRRRGDGIGPAGSPGGGGSAASRWRSARDATIAVGVLGSFAVTWVVGLVTIARWIW